MVRVSMRLRLISLVAAVYRRCFPGQGVELRVQAGLVAEDGPQVVCVLDLPEEERVVPGRLHRVRCDQDPVEGQRLQQRPEVGDLVRLPGLGDLVLADDQAGDVGDHSEQVHLLVPAGLGELAFLAVHGGRGPGGHVPWIAVYGRVQPGMGRVRAEPAVAALLAETRRGRRLPLPFLPVFLLPALFFRHGTRPGPRGRARRRPRTRTGQPRARRRPAVSGAGPASRRTAGPAARSAG